MCRAFVKTRQLLEQALLIPSRKPVWDPFDDVTTPELAQIGERSLDCSEGRS